MSIGNLKDSGNQGNNFPWQLKMLQGLQAIANATSAPLTCVDDSVTICNTNIDALTFTTVGGNDALNVNIVGGAQRTANFLRPTGTNGSISAGVYSVSFASVGTGDAIVGGMVLKPGETLNFDAGAVNNTIGAITYNTTTNPGAELIIVTLT